MKTTADASTTRRRMVSEFGATLGCKGCLVMGQAHTECRARITTRMENDPSHAKRLEDNLTKRTVFVNPEPGGCCAKNGQNRRDEKCTLRRARADTRICKHRRSFEHLGGDDVNTRSISAGKQPLEPGGDADMVCGLDVRRSQ